MGGACSTYGERSVSNTISLRIPEGKGPLGKPRSRWDGKFILKKWVYWIDVAQDREMWLELFIGIMNLRVP
jgi:hypothetical protein